MGGATRQNKGSNSYKSMASSSQSKKAYDTGPSRLTVSRLEQVPTLPKHYVVKKLLAGDLPLNDTMSIASGYTVTGAVIGPNASLIQQVERETPSNGSGLLDYFSTPQSELNGGSNMGQFNPISPTTGESEEL